jgi:phytoene dehydrogenase-like protein
MDRYDVIVIGAGLGGLVSAALIAQSGRKTLLIERNYGVGGAASTYKSGDLVVEASLHETSDPRDVIDPKNPVLAELGVLDKVKWVPTGAVYEVRGGPVGVPFVLPEGFAAARAAFLDRFPATRGVGPLLAEMESIATGLGIMSRGRRAFDNPLEGLSALLKLGPVVRGWRLSLAERLQRACGDDEAAKCALAANMVYWHDDPDTLWWILFAVAQGGYIGSGGCYVEGGSQRLSNALARAFKAAGGELLLRRTVSEILLDGEGRPIGVAHEGKDGEGRVEARAPVVVSNAAPAHVKSMLPTAARKRFFAPYDRRPLSISLFSATFGLSSRPADVGFSAYSTFLLPEWMTALSDYRRCAAILADPPDEGMPAIAVVDYSAIDSGLGGPPYPVSVVGPDRLANWSGLDGAAYDEKRNLWRTAIITAIDRVFPGFAEKVVASVFSTASTMLSYLNAPEGAVYGFAPHPPAGPIWKGPDSSPTTPVPGLYLASSYAGSGGYTGAILAGAAAARQVLAARPSASSGR